MDEWTQVLDAFEANLELVERQLAAPVGSAPAALAPLVAPPGLMPSELAGRADDLLGRSIALEEAIAERLDDRNSRPPPVRWPQHRARRGRVNVAL